MTFYFHHFCRVLTSILLTILPDSQAYLLSVKGLQGSVLAPLGPCTTLSLSNWFNPSFILPLTSWTSSWKLRVYSKWGKHVNTKETSLTQDPNVCRDVAHIYIPSLDLALELSVVPSLWHNDSSFIYVVGILTHQLTKFWIIPSKADIVRIHHTLVLSFMAHPQSAYDFFWLMWHEQKYLPSGSAWKSQLWFTSSFLSLHWSGVWPLRPRACPDSFLSERQQSPSHWYARAKAPCLATKMLEFQVLPTKPKLTGHEFPSQGILLHFGIHNILAAL